jgi:hypothetical protein
MKKIPPNRVRSHADFDLTPLGIWANHRDAATLTAGGQRVQRLNDLPNPFASDASMKFGEAVALHARGYGMTNRRGYPERDGGVLPGPP